jgi:hypothetical protein
MSVSQDLVPIEFERGPFGEIVPPSLAAGMPADEALEMLARDSGTPAGEVENLGLVYVHQRCLRRAIAGELNDDDAARDLYRAVVVEGEPLSLRPLGQEERVFSTFAPVLQHIEGELWRVGVAEQGRTREFTAPLGRVVELAQGVFVEWFKTEVGR